MIKHIKIILAFILAIIISVSISVYATLQYSASQITYGNTTLDHTLDDLYTKTNSFPNFSSATYSIDQGTTVPSREASKSVSKGKYIILRNEATGWPISSTSSYAASSGASNKSLTCDSNNCTITQISGYYKE